MYCTNTHMRYLPTVQPVLQLLMATWNSQVNNIIMLSKEGYGLLVAYIDLIYYKHTCILPFSSLTTSILLCILLALERSMCGAIYLFIFDHQEIKDMVKMLTIQYTCNNNTYSLIIYTHGWLPVYHHLCQLQWYSDNISTISNVFISEFLYHAC